MYLNSNLLRDSKQEETSYYIKTKDREIEIVQRKDPLYIESFVDYRTKQIEIEWYCCSYIGLYNNYL